MNTVNTVVGLGLGLGLAGLGWLIWRQYKALRQKRSLLDLAQSWVGTGSQVAAVVGTSQPPTQPPNWLLLSDEQLFRGGARSEADRADALLRAERDESLAATAASSSTPSVPAPKAGPQPELSVGQRPTLDPMTPLIRETPTPGHLYTVESCDDLTGIAAAALHVAALAAGCKKGWSTEKTEARAAKLATDPRAQAAYVDLILRSSWNAPVGDQPPAGACLWLPPLRTAALFDRTRRCKVTLSGQTWPDGSSRLEPPSSPSNANTEARASATRPAKTCSRFFAPTIDSRLTYGALVTD